MQSGPPSKQRKIEPFISYIDKGCGSGLLEKQSDDSRLREDIYRLILAEDAEVQLEALFAKAEGSERLHLKKILAHFAGSDTLQASASAELKKVEEISKTVLHKNTQDPFRAATPNSGNSEFRKTLETLQL